MTRRARFVGLATLALTTLLITGPALAQIQDQTDYLRLSWRYDQLLKAKEGQAATSIQAGINNERGTIRSEIERTITNYLKSEESADSVDLMRILDKQRSIVAVLNEQIDGTKADIALLAKEENYYKQKEKTGTGTVATGQALLTKSYPELLAKKAVLEERLTALQAFRNTEQDRLRSLQAEQQVRSIGLLLNILTYLAIFLLVFWIERMLRRGISALIPHRRIRYGVTKAFTFIIYVVLAFWFIQHLLSEYPGIVTVVAIIGGALVFVLQDAIKGIIGWLGFRNSFSLGQRVTIGAVTGDIIDMGIFYTTLLVARTPDMTDPGQVGKIVRIPNVRLLTESLVNYHATSDFENVECSIIIAKAEQWEAAHGILEEILRKETDAYAQKAQRQTDMRMRGFYSSHINPSWRIYMEFTTKQEVRFTLCFPAPIGKRRAVTTVLVKEILRRFAEAGITMKTEE